MNRKPNAKQMEIMHDFNGSHRRDIFALLRFHRPRAIDGIASHFISAKMLSSSMYCGNNRDYFVVI